MKIHLNNNYSIDMWTNLKDTSPGSSYVPFLDKSQVYYKRSHFGS